jgi:hypothetical protein
LLGLLRAPAPPRKLVKDDAGDPIEIRERSDHLMATLLKGHRPEKHRENVSIRSTVTHELSVLADNAIKRLEATTIDVTSDAEIVQIPALAHVQV